MKELPKYWESSTATINERDAQIWRMFHCNNKRKRRPYIENNCMWKFHWLTRPRRTSVYQTEDMRLQPETSEEGPVERAGSGDLAFQTTAWGVRVIKPVRCFFVWQLQTLTNACYYFLLYCTLLFFVGVFCLDITVHAHGYFHMHLQGIILYWLLQLVTWENGLSIWQSQITAYAINCFLFLSRGWLIHMESVTN
jgi:hypothetical protein